ncbi:CRISPR-associated protein Cas7/Cst2/DevR, subtype I-B/TNEAP [Marinitoga piezophila KA3]|uniref:CRISPR-associated protein Cas7/Cst2/DevR, subtype I-B/TNEAP n=1 Tax=Marinitoga piezophila (strain DSM 14283 / JCM 11233 / KA3) TaxID=443254 RepID=H2J3Z8_MARPK|nr:type I-B CRISPR-associated protein Cas7/Cst2/DevR [Marinitoga piezophila]AEX84726.1 CRISPR-associated protein Cas7/Cst2/DevR, subtype I-B/TNEAP [Marinitoga piezophila KA3]
MNTIQGFMLIDVDVAALNNAGNDTSTTLDNAVMTKKIRKDGKEYPYVSGQAWRYWWRETLMRNFNWQISPIIREKKIAYTEADPLKYADDDIFGYMRAGKKNIIDTKTGKSKSINVTLTRVSPLKNSALIAVSYNPIVQHWSSMSRHEGDAVPYGKDEYCAIMKGMFSIDLDMVGTFSSMNKTGFQNINEDMRQLYLEKEGVFEIDDPFAKDINGNPLKLIRLPKEIREQRVKDVILALKYLSGGAKQTTNFADVTPKIIVLAILKSGNHPFSHLAKEEMGKAVFSVDALKEVINDYQDKFDNKIFVGKRKGFMDEIESDLIKLKEENLIEYGSVNKIIDKFVKTIDLGE